MLFGHWEYSFGHLWISMMLRGFLIFFSDSGTKTPSMKMPAIFSFKLLEPMVVSEKTIQEWEAMQSELMIFLGCGMR